MEISISRDDLIKPLGQAAGVVEKRQTLPILAYVLLRQQGGQLALTGTDLEVEVTAVTKAANTGADGEATVPARKLLDICRGLPANAAIKINLKGENAVVRSGKSRFTLVTMPAIDFPAIEASEWAETFTVPQKALKILLEKTQFCMAHQDVRYYLNGLLLELDGKALRAIATDGHRMALSEVVLDESSGNRQIIVPRKGVLELTRFLEDSDKLATVRLGTNHIRVELPGLTFTSKLIDGRFPDYNKVIPANQSKELIIDRQLFRDAMSRAAILSNEKYRGVRLNLSAGTLTITAHNPEQEEAEEQIELEYGGEELEIGFNVNYMIEAASALDSEQIKLGLNDPNSSCTLVMPDSSGALYVIMPMRL